METLRERSQSSQPFKSVPALYDAPEQASNSKVGRPLSEAEKQAIAQILRVNPPATPPLRFEQTPKFILHDTSGELSDEAIYNLTQQSRGPLGLGIAAFVSRDGKVTLARSFFRPAPSDSNRLRKKRRYSLRNCSQSGNSTSLAIN
ncbi:MAG: hypothetical protein HC784_14060 [Hydrococcus sp. CSU_1_8]|nr:hypothetical protein [Hydrococcus sp. CSU_1_8]